MLEGDYSFINQKQSNVHWRTNEQRISLSGYRIIINGHLLGVMNLCDKQSRLYTTNCIGNQGMLWIIGFVVLIANENLYL